MAFGADDAWYETAFNIEHHRVTNTHYSGGASDIYKCFDQICWPLLYRIATAAGIPHKILTAYISFQDNLSIFNNLALGLGTPYQRQNSIPQGCPLSMMFTALLLRPWMCLIPTDTVIPRTLADDLLTVTTGPRHSEELIGAIEKNHTFLKDMGAAVATTKSTLFSITEGGKKQLRDHTWPYNNTKIKVVNSFRDLGSHINLTQTPTSSTLKDRIRQHTKTTTTLQPKSTHHPNQRAYQSIIRSGSITSTRIFADSIYYCNKERHEYKMQFQGHECYFHNGQLWS